MLGLNLKDCRIDAWFVVPFWYGWLFPLLAVNQLFWLTNWFILVDHLKSSKVFSVLFSFLVNYSMLKKVVNLYAHCIVFPSWRVGCQYCADWPPTVMCVCVCMFHSWQVGCHYRFCFELALESRGIWLSLGGTGSVNQVSTLTASENYLWICLSGRVVC